MKISFIPALLLFSCQLYCQNYTYREYSVLDGLPQSQIHMMVQDSFGFLWISTRNGISRFDGVEFTNFTKKDGLPSSSGNTLVIDKDGLIWAISDPGVALFTGKKFRYIPPPPEYKETLFRFGSAVSIRNELFILTGQPQGDITRLFLIRDSTYIHYSSLFPALDTLQIRDFRYWEDSDELIFQDFNGGLWAWKNESLRRLSPDKIEYFSAIYDPVTVISNGKRYRYNGSDFSAIDESDLNFRPVFQIDTARNSNSLSFFDGTSTCNIRLPTKPNGGFIDSEGNLWIISEKNLIRVLSTAFSYLSAKDIPVTNIWTIQEDRNGHIWLGSLYGQLAEFDGQSFRIRDEYRDLFVEGTGFYKGSARLENGDIWFSTNSGILIWDGNTFSRLRELPEYTQVCFIYEDPPDKKVLIGTDKGLFIIAEGKMAGYYPEFTDSNLGVIEGIEKSDSGYYWLSGHKGLVYFNGEQAFPVRENGLTEESTYTLLRDHSGGLWITSEAGLFYKPPGDKSIVNGLPAAYNLPAYSIIGSDSTHLLVGRTSDICYINLDKFYRNDPDYFRILDKTDGFEGQECLDNGMVKDRNGRIWILTSENVVVFDPSRLKPNNNPPVMHITGLFSQTDTSDWQELLPNGRYYYEGEAFTLRRRDNGILIRFTGISTSNPDKVLFQYRLAGFDDTWSLPGKERFANYEHLPNGSYSFELRSINADNVASLSPITMSITVLPEIWQRTSFKVVAAVFAIVITILATWAIIRKEQLKREEAQKLKLELVNLQMNAVIKQFDPHFTFNVISSIGSLVVRDEKDAAYGYIAKLSRLLRSVLSDGSVVVKTLNDELDFVKQYCDLQKLRFGNRFECSISVDEGIDLLRPVPKMTIQIFVENAIKHGFENRKEGGRLDVSVKHADNTLRIKISDNGVGRSASARSSGERTGSGIKIITGMFDLMNTYNPRNAAVKISDLLNDGKPAGTEVEIYIPDNYRFIIDPENLKSNDLR